MTEPFPRYEFVPLPPPPGGMARALRDGRRARLRRRVLGSSIVAAVMVAVIGTFAATASSGPGASDQLIPAVAPSTKASPAPDTAPRAAVQGRPAATPAGRPGAATAGLGTRVAQSSSGQPGASAGATPAPEAAGAAARPSSYRTPDLLRSYRAPAPTQGPNPTLCSGASSAGRGGVDASTNWCVTAKVATTARGHDLSLQVCRDSTTAAQLHFSRRLEADLVVLSGARTVWRWSVGHEDPTQTHALDVAADACWTWTAPWTDVDGAGRPLPAGDYTLVVTSPATELRAYDDKRAAFSIR